MLPVLFAVRLDLVHMEVPPPSLPSFACDFEPAVLATLTAQVARSKDECLNLTQPCS